MTFSTNRGATPLHPQSDGQLRTEGGDLHRSLKKAEPHFRPAQGSSTRRRWSGARDREALASAGRTQTPPSSSCSHVEATSQPRDASSGTGGYGSAEDTA